MILPLSNLIPITNSPCTINPKRHAIWRGHPRLGHCSRGQSRIASKHQSTRADDATKHSGDPGFLAFKAFPQFAS